MESIFSIQDVVKRFQTATVLDHINLEIEQAACMDLSAEMAVAKR